MFGADVLQVVPSSEGDSFLVQSPIQVVLLLHQRLSVVQVQRFPSTSL